MDDLVSEFITETTESLSLLDRELVRFEQNPTDEAILGNIFRVMHTIKGTCGFLQLPKLEKTAHAGEDVLGRFRDHTLHPTPDAVSAILHCVDVIRRIINSLSETGNEGDEDDSSLLQTLKALAGKKPTESVSNVVTEKQGPVVDPGGFPVAAELLDEVLAATPSAVEPIPSPPSIPTPESEKTVVPPPKASPPAAEKPLLKVVPPAQTIRVSVDVLENLMNLVSEMVLTRNQLLQVSRKLDIDDLKEPLQRLNRNTADLQEGVMKTRMQPIGNAWSKLPRIVRDLANELGKRIELEMMGEDTELDRQVLELIQDPLTHMVRNSADHGLEKPEERLMAGKPETGVIRLSAFHEGGHIIIKIVDDGRGINTSRIRQKIIERGLATEGEVAALSDAEVNAYIMKAGFSTAEAVTKVSGRGVGMDVVRSNIEKIGGSVSFQSEQGQGSEFTIKIPLTLAIISALLVDIGIEQFALPQITVHEVVRISERSDHHIEALNGMPILRLRDELLPLINMGSLLELSQGETGWRPGTNTFDGYVVVCRSGDQMIGLIVDKIIGTEEIVVKPLSALLGSPRYLAGNTVLGDGQVILILDVNSLAGTINKEHLPSRREADRAEKQIKNLETVLLFESGNRATKAIPLAQIHRIEQVDMAQVEMIQGNPVIQYRDGLLPLFDANGQRRLRETGNQTILVFGEGDEYVGIGIEKIVDVINGELRVLTQSSTPGVTGSGIIEQRAVDILDSGHFLTWARTQHQRMETHA